MTTPSPAAAAPPDGDKLDAGVMKIAGVVVLGAVMSILDVTVVSVALPTFQTVFDASYATVAWTMTGYTLALATVIPLTGWAADRFGTKRLYMLALTLFLLGSIACGLAWDIGSLITFRVLQGLGGGMLMPLGMTIMTRAAGPTPHRPGDGDPRCAHAARPDRRPDPRRLAHRGRELALDLLHQRADRHRGADRRVARAGEGSPDAVRDLRLRRHAAAVARPGAVPVRGLEHSRAGHRGVRDRPWPRPGRSRVDGRVRVARAPTPGSSADRPAPVPAPPVERLGDHDVAVRDRVLRVDAAAADLLHPGARGEHAHRRPAARAAGSGRDADDAARRPADRQDGPRQVRARRARADHCGHGRVHPDHRYHAHSAAAVGAVRDGHGHGHDDDADHDVGPRLAAQRRGGAGLDADEYRPAVGGVCRHRGDVGHPHRSAAEQAGVDGGAGGRGGSEPGREPDARAGRPGALARWQRLSRRRSGWRSR